ncbi:MAG: ion transporter [Ignavibacteria bacterium]|nr:ion transporter [Ignavibacteria bacterium]MBK6420291.1 ion transporter [Ignavibacteria bacterium]MBK7412757.1 ion transporter [Ignavibacteria bacterium]
MLKSLHRSWRTISGLDAFTILLVALTAVYLGIEASISSGRYANVLRSFDWLLLLMLVIEFTWRTLSEGPPWKQINNRFRGLSIVGKARQLVPLQQEKVPSVGFVHSTMYVIDLIVIPLYLATLLDSVTLDMHELTLIRMLRLLVVVRVIDVSPLRDFVTTVLHSLKSVMYALIVMGIHFYIYAVAGTFLFRKADPQAFGDLPTACITLMHVNGGEGFTSILTELNKYGGIYGTIGTAYFNSYVFIGVILLVGIVTAMITNDVWDHRNKANHDARNRFLRASYRHRKRR